RALYPYISWKLPPRQRLTTVIGSPWKGRWHSQRVGLLPMLRLRIYPKGARVARGVALGDRRLRFHRHAGRRATPAYCRPTAMLPIAASSTDDFRGGADSLAAMTARNDDGY